MGQRRQDMNSSDQIRSPIKRVGMRQAIAGVIYGMAFVLVLKGYVSTPVAAVHAALNDAGSISEMASKLGESRYRVAMHCPLKNHRVSYHIKARNDDGAQAALGWLMPACALSQVNRGQSADDGQTWYLGQFSCQGNFFKKIQHVSASDVEQARQRALAAANGCRVETIDQTDCPLLAPLCVRASEDFRVEAELERHRLLR